MCRPDAMAKSTTPVLNRSSSSVLSVEAFGSKPSVITKLKYGAGVLVFLYAVEHFLRYLFVQNQHFHPLLENETNRNILARHLGTDCLCCFIVALMGITGFTTICPEFLSVASGQKGAVPKGGYEARMFTYQPAAYRMCLFFFLYQIKNLTDCLVWNDGLLFIAHHVMTLAVAYGTIVHCVSHAYAPFFFGISEISTAILCLLSNFDDDHGVPGLGDAFPHHKVAIGALFAIAFISCRVILWSFFGYFFVHDALLAINNTDSTRDAARPWVKTFLGSFIGLSALQVLWLGQIIYVAKEELSVFLA